MRQRVHRMPSILPRQEKIVTKPKRSKKFIWWVILAMLIGGVYWVIFVGPAFAIESIEVTGTDHKSVQTIADQWKGQNIFRMSNTSIEQEIKQAYPPVDKVTLARGLPHTVRIAVTLRNPVLRWQANNGTYILDAQGQAFEEGDKEAYKDLPKVTDYSGIPVSIGQQVILPAFIDFIQETQEIVPNLFQKKITAYEVHGSTFHIDVLLEGDTRLKLTTQRPSKEQLEGAKAIYTAHSETKHIDVRVPGRGYYK